MVILSASISTTDLEGDEWGAFGGLPDPYVRVWYTSGYDYFGDYETPAIDDTLSPDWDEYVLISGIRASDLRNMSIIFNDEDAVDDDWIGECSAIFTPHEAPVLESILRGEVQRCVYEGSTLRYRFDPHRP